jgi:hypothetical protein
MESLEDYIGKLKRKAKKAVLTLGTSLVMGYSSNAIAEYSLITNFGSGYLGSDIYGLRTDENSVFTDTSHIIDEEFRVEQEALGITNNDKGAILDLKREFNVGETLEHKLRYNSGSGNHISYLVVNGVDPVFEQGKDSPVVGVAGLWHGEDYGRDAGEILVRYTFYPDRIQRVIDRGGILETDSIGVSGTENEIYTLGFGTRVRPGSLIDIAYDDFGVYLVNGDGTPAMDTDMDMLDDGWEEEHFGDTEEETYDDSDGDGLHNLQEFNLNSNPNSYMLNLNKGWNLVSIAGVPEDNSVGSIFGGVPTIGRVWTWENGRFKTATHIGPLQGYWVYCDEEATVPITVNRGRGVVGGGMGSGSGSGSGNSGGE